MKTFRYAACGSNLHPLRLRAHDRCPSAELLGTCVINGWCLAFRKRSTDGSAKCDADRTGNPLDELRIAVFEIPESEEEALDRAEGLNYGYHKDKIPLIMGGGAELIAKVYLADREAIVTDAPYEWYKPMVLLGAEYHCFPMSYTEQIREVGFKTDSNESGAQEKWIEVERMKSANKKLKATR